MTDKNKMDDIGSENAGVPAKAVSRRDILKTLAAGGSVLAMTPFMAGCNGAYAGAITQPRFAYAGAYTPNGKGIYQFSADSATGALTTLKTYSGIASPSWLTFTADGSVLYAVNETTDYNGTTNGSVSAFRVNPANGDLTLINVVDAQGGAPVYAAVHPGGRFLLVANYMGATVAVFPIQANGGLDAAVNVTTVRGPLGPATPAEAPSGSFVSSGHDASHAHQVLTDPAGRHVYVSDLGTDRIYIYEFNAASGALTPASPSYVPFSAGSGPRHFVFHPHARYLYAVTEEASTLVVFDYDASSGRLTQKQSVSLLPTGFAGTSYASEVIVSPDGKFVYAGNRLHDSVAIFAVNETNGTVTRSGEAWTHGSYPRHISIDWSGGYLYACNQRSDAITAFKIDKASGNLTFTGQYTPVGNPAILLFR
jgi:6-phosphogluconolactonase (cycloisomerase 2 family)